MCVAGHAHTLVVFMPVGYRCRLDTDARDIDARDARDTGDTDAQAQRQPRCCRSGAHARGGWLVPGCDLAVPSCTCLLFWPARLPACPPAHLPACLPSGPLRSPRPNWPPQDEPVTLLEVSTARPSPLQLLSAGAAAGPTGMLRWAATLGLLLRSVLGGSAGSGAMGAGAAEGGWGAVAAAAVGAPLLMELAAAAGLTGGQGDAGLATAGQLAARLAAGQALALMPTVSVEGAGSEAAVLGGSGAGRDDGAGGLFDES